MIPNRKERGTRWTERHEMERSTDKGLIDKELIDKELIDKELIDKGLIETRNSKR